MHLKKMEKMYSCLTLGGKKRSRGFVWTVPVVPQSMNLESKVTETGEITFKHNTDYNVFSLKLHLSLI